MVGTRVMAERRHNNPSLLGLRRGPRIKPSWVLVPRNVSLLREAAGGLSENYMANLGMAWTIKHGTCFTHLTSIRVNATSSSGREGLGGAGGVIAIRAGGHGRTRKRNSRKNRPLSFGWPSHGKEGLR